MVVLYSIGHCGRIWKICAQTIDGPWGGGPMLPAAETGRCTPGSADPSVVMHPHCFLRKPWVTVYTRSRLPLPRAR